MTDTEEFNHSQATLFDMFDNEDIEFMFESEEFEDWVEHTETLPQLARKRYSKKRFIQLA